MWLTTQGASVKGGVVQGGRTVNYTAARFGWFIELTFKISVHRYVEIGACGQFNQIKMKTKMKNS